MLRNGRKIKRGMQSNTLQHLTRRTQALIEHVSRTLPTLRNLWCPAGPDRDGIADGESLFAMLAPETSAAFIVMKIIIA